MRRFKRGVFCYYLLGFPSDMHAWLFLLMRQIRIEGLLNIGDVSRVQVAQWLVGLFNRSVDFETMVHTLLGDAFFEQNRRDVIAVERLVGRPIISLWDTDPIFIRYPHLRGLARNLEFERHWAQVKKLAASKQK